MEKNNRELRVLFVEDNEMDAFPIQYTIEEEFQGCSIDVVSSKKAAMEKVEELCVKGESYDFFIIDIMLDDSVYAGIDFAEEVGRKYRRPDSPMPAVIVTSMLTESDFVEYGGDIVHNPQVKKEEIIERLRNAHVTKIMSKPIDTEELTNIIKDIITNRSKKGGNND